MIESLFPWTDTVEFLPVALLVIPYLLWAVAMLSAYSSQSKDRGMWLLILGLGLIVAPLFAAIAYFLFRNKPGLFDFTKGLTSTQFKQKDTLKSEQETQHASTIDSSEQSPVTGEPAEQIPQPLQTPENFHTYVPPLPDKPSDKYEVLK